MKKIVLLSLVMSIGFLGFSQERIQTTKSLRNISKTAVFVNPTDEVVNVSVAQNPYVSNYKELVGEDVIGTTFYDLQSNALLSNRIHVYPDGTIGAVWTRGVEGAPGFSGRGTGYNFFDGNQWLDAPTARVENERTGWPSYAPLGENGEIIVSHLVSGLMVSTREQKATGDWTFQALDGPTDLTWPRMITDGEENNIVHLITNSYDPYEGQTRALLYYRSLDAGVTWDIEAEILDGMGSDYYTEINADTYVWAEPNGGAIAFLVGGAWHDMFMMKSTDNGENWEKTVIWEHPYPFFDWDVTIADTFYCVDNSASIALDMDGVAHVVFGIGRVAHFEVGNTYNYWPYTDGVGYWDETMPTFSNNLYALSPYTEEHPDSEMVEDYNLIGWTQDVDGDGEITFLDELMSYHEIGISTMPSIAVDNFGTVLVAYASTTETYDNTIYNYKHIWVRQKEATENWGAFEDLDENVAHMFDECIYPVIGQNIYQENQNTYIIYQADYEPGLAFKDDHPWVENRMIVANYNIGVGVNDHGAVADFLVSQNIPNPANNSTSIMVETEKAGVINLTISNLLGQVVHHESVNNSAPIYTFNVNVSNLNSGIYFYTIEVGNKLVTKKMLVE